MKSKIIMLDKSVFIFPNKHWIKAFEMKYGSKIDVTIKIFREITKKHYDARTIPTKFGTDAEWEQEYKNHGELGVGVMYIYIRTALMVIAFEGICKDLGKKPIKVVGIGSDGTLREYSSKGVKKIKKL